MKDKAFLDMGSGSGIQAETALRFKASSITALDINDESIKLLKNKFKSNIIKAIKSNLFSNIKKREKFDVIAFNPPYLPKDEREDSQSSLATTGGRKGDEIIISFLKQAQKHLNKKGVILLIASSLTPLDRIDNLLKKLRLKKKVLDTEKLFFEKLELWEIREQ